MISVFIVWVFSAILTAAGAFEKGHRARTDTRLSVLEKVPWFRVPYPGTLQVIEHSDTLYKACEIFVE